MDVPKLPMSSVVSTDYCLPFALISILILSQGCDLPSLLLNVMIDISLSPFFSPISRDYWLTRLHRLLTTTVQDESFLSLIGGVSEIKYSDPNCLQQYCLVNVDIAAGGGSTSERHGSRIQWTSFSMEGSVFLCNGFQRWWLGVWL